MAAGLRCANIGRKTWRKCVKDGIWLSLVCTLNGKCSGICGKASNREKRLTLARHGINRRFKIKDSDDDHYPHPDTEYTFNIDAKCNFMHRLSLI